MSSFFRSGFARNPTMSDARLRAWYFANNLVPPAGDDGAQGVNGSELGSYGPEQIVTLPRRSILAGLAALLGKTAVGMVATRLPQEAAPAHVGSVNEHAYVNGTVAMAPARFAGRSLAA